MARITNLLAGAACLSLVATPVAAAELPVPAAPHHAAAPAEAYDGEAENAERHRRYRGWRHRNRIDAGDVLAGVLVIGGIAAIASAASKNKRDRDYRDRDYRYRYPEQREDYRYRQDNRDRDSQFEGRGMSRAVDMCVDQVERGDDEVAAVDNASRTADGWRISGQLERGGGFNCWIDNEGRIRDIDIGGEFSAYDGPAGEDAQYDDDVYHSARAGQGAAAPEVFGNERGDDRYDAGQQGDFGSEG